MSELTDKLRSYNPTSGYSTVMRKAADEIERLTTENNRLINSSVMNSPYVNGQAAEQLPQSWRNRLGID